MEILSDILLDKRQRKDLIKRFQKQVWNQTIDYPNNIYEILSELAYDLDFYEPNEEWRKEDASYYALHHICK